ncbi:DNA-binding domain-containing protein [Gammaproteobacteria bacterium]|nr:DNA-binding domain-containing protein [Gammaproteobacteria bacterium]
MSSQLHDIQSNFTAYLRDPDTSAHPSDVPLERVRVHEDLVFRNISSLLTNNFPVVAECKGSDWNALMRGFIRDHRAQAPNFPQLPLEFLAYLDSLPRRRSR